MWRDLLCALGLACAPEPVQPDVSAFTVLSLLMQTDARPALMQPALGALYEGVHVSLQQTHLVTGLDTVLYRLSRDGVEKATLRCDTLTSEAMIETPGWGANQPPKLQAALVSPWNDDTQRRASCIFVYTDTSAYTDAFFTQSEIWAEHDLGPLTPDASESMPNGRIAQNADGNVHLHMIKGGLPNASFSVLRLVRDLSTP